MDFQRVKAGWVYIMANRRNGTIYTGSTSQLVQRAWQHREGVVEGFTSEHGCSRLVWFEGHDDMQDARRTRGGAKCRSRRGKGRGGYG